MSWAELPQDLLHYQLELVQQASIVCQKWKNLPIPEYAWQGNMNLAMRARKIIFNHINESELSQIQEVLEKNKYLKRLKIYNPLRREIPLILDFLPWRLKELTLVDINPILPTIPALRKLRLLKLNVIPDLYQLFNNNPISSLEINFTGLIMNILYREYLDFRPFNSLKELKLNVLPLINSTLKVLDCWHGDQNMMEFWLSLRNNQILTDLKLLRLDVEQLDWQIFIEILQNKKSLKSLSLTIQTGVNITPLLTLPLESLELPGFMLDSQDIAMLDRSLKVLKAGMFPDAGLDNAPALEVLSISWLNYLEPTKLFLNLRKLAIFDSDLESIGFMQFPWSKSQLTHLTLSSDLKLGVLLDKIQEITTLHKLTLSYSLIYNHIKAVTQFIKLTNLKILKLEGSFLGLEYIKLLADALIQNKKLEKFILNVFYFEKVYLDFFIPVIQHRYQPIKIILRKGAHEYNSCNGSFIKY